MFIIVSEFNIIILIFFNEFSISVNIFLLLYELIKISTILHCYISLAQQFGSVKSCNFFRSIIIITNG